MLKIAKTSLEKVEKINLSDLFQDITEEMKRELNKRAVLKKDIIDFVKKDRVGIQFNAVRVCKIPADPAPLEKEIEDLEFELEQADETDSRYKSIKRQLFSKRKEFDKLKQPYKYFDDICECYTACPLYREGLAPVGEQCYFESQKVAQATESYINEFQIDPMTQTIAKEQIAQIVLCDLLIYRASRALATTNLTMIGEKIGELGVEYTRQRNHLLGLITEQNKTRNKLLETMLGTPEIKKKYKIEAKKSMRQADAEKSTAKLIQEREEYISKSKMPTLIDIAEAEVVG